MSSISQPFSLRLGELCKTGSRTILRARCCGVLLKTAFWSFNRAAAHKNAQQLVACQRLEQKQTIQNSSMSRKDTYEAHPYWQLTGVW